jgi:hypothetical protein
MGRVDRVRGAGVRRLYGTSPLHLIAHLALLPLAVWALVQVFSVSSSKAAAGIAAWLVAAAVLHDLALLPLYSGADRAARVALRGAVNYVRVPAGLSLLMLLVFWGTIAGKGGRTYHAVSGRSYDGYALRWLLVTAALFAGSALVYRLRRGGGSRS